MTRHGASGTVSHWLGVASHDGMKTTAFPKSLDAKAELRRQGTCGRHTSTSADSVASAQNHRQCEEFVIAPCRSCELKKAHGHTSNQKDGGQYLRHQKVDAKQARELPRSARTTRISNQAADSTCSPGSPLHFLSSSFDQAKLA